MESPTPLHYEDYRKFLSDLYLWKKDQTKRYSYRQFAQDLGFSPSNYFHLIINSKRDLTNAAFETIIKNLNLSTPEKNYFKVLVKLNHTTDPTQKKILKIKLSKILGNNRTVLKTDQEQYFGRWYIPILREVLALKNTVSNLGWLAKKLNPAISEKEVLEAIKVLERLGFVKKVGNRWIQKKEHLTTENEITSAMIFNYHKEMLSLSAKTLSHPAPSRDISAMTMSLNTEQFEWLKKRLFEFRHEIQEELDDQANNQTLVAQLNMQLFQVTQK